MQQDAFPLSCTTRARFSHDSRYAEPVPTRSTQIPARSSSYYTNSIVHIASAIPGTTCRTIGTVAALLRTRHNVIPGLRKSTHLLSCMYSSFFRYGGEVRQIASSGCCSYYHTQYVILLQNLLKERRNSSHY